MNSDRSKLALRLALGGSGLVLGYFIIKKVTRVISALQYSVDIDDGPDSESRRSIPPSEFDYISAAKQHNSAQEAASPMIITNDKALSEAQVEGSLVYLRYANCDLYLLGSAHVSKKSAELAYRIVRAARPDSLVVELCIDRQQILWREPKHKQAPMIDDPLAYHQGGEGGQEEEGERGNVQEAKEVSKGGGGAAGTLSSIARSLKGGHNAFHAVLNSVYEEIEAQLNTTMGLEFIRARQALVDNLTCPAVDLSPPNSSSSSSSSSTPPVLPDPLLIEERFRRRTRFMYQTKSLKSRPSLLAYKKESGEGMARAYPYIELERSWQGNMGHMEQRLRPIDRSRIIYGDVSVGMTVRRCWGALSPWEKVSLLWGLLVGCLTQKLDEGLIESFMKEDMLKLIEKELGGSFPRLIFPLLHERNVHLANSIRAAAGYVKEQEDPSLTPLMPPSVIDITDVMEEVLSGGQEDRKVVVAVVGKGHLPGLVYALINN